ncbi:MAG: YbaK/EbsC family protein [Candidatus Bathyarchaeia archaeon]|jgi:Cys-tRNA(Pro) deacylase
MTLNDNVLRVKEFIKSRGVEAEIVTFNESTRTSELAAATIGCEVAQIAKSLVFIADDQETILVIASGRNRVDTEKLAERVGNRRVKIADAKTVKRVTGFPVGGVPPVGHSHPLRTILDPTLMKFRLVYAAAGTPNAVFGINPRDLKELTGAELAEVFQH